MRRLNDSYWNKFTKEDVNGTIKRDGIVFEDLVECLLQIEYGNKWIRTPKSHDNSRDFHLTTPEFTHWAECKNYKDSIALDVIAPTLVMAQIFDVNKLIFFSYSDINFSAKNKIFSFGSKTKKEIIIFSGNTLDDLIIKNKKNLPEKFRPQNEQVNKNMCKESLEHQFYFIQTPILGVTSDDRDLISICDVQKIIYNTIFEIAFVCTNNSLDSNYRIELSLNEALGKDNSYFTLVDYELENEAQPFLTYSIPSAGGIINRYYFKSNRFKPSLILPVFNVKIFRNEEIIRSFSSPVHIVKNQWIGKTILIGEQYRNAVSRMEKYILDNDEISCFMIHGSSGTGKTRLLKEMLDSLLKHKYRIVSFIGNEEDSAYILIKELIYFIFEVPRDEILQNLEKDFFAQEHITDVTPARQAYILAQRFSKAHSDSELIEVIDESFDILFEKISKERIAIVIDNIQFFGNAIIHFLQKYIIYSKHQTRANSSVLLLSINEDYITEKATELLRYMQDLSKDNIQFSCCKVTGFRNKNQGILFLRELLHVSDERLDSEFEIILNKSSLTPYYIYQAVYYLYEEDAIGKSDDEKGYIPRLEKFHDVIEKMPPKINDIILERWTSLINRFSLDEEEANIIVASVYLFRELSSHLIFLLGLNLNVLEYMNQRAFLKLNDNGNYCFDHDIIENFFIARVNHMESLVVNRIRKCRKARVLTKYPFVNLYYKLCSRKFTTETIQDIYAKTLTLTIHSKLADLFYSKLLEIILDEQKKFEEEKWMSMVFGICNLAKNCIGIKKSEILFVMANAFLNENITEEILLTNAFRNYMNIYADILFFQKKHEEAITYLEHIMQIPLDRATDQVYALKSMLFNRLMINHREFDSSYHKKQSIEYLSKAKLYANKLQDPLLKDEFTYLNISDEGYNYYCMYNQKDRLLAIWNTCLEYSPARLPQKAMNYYRKRIQINLIEQKYNNVFEIIEEATEYMNIHQSTNVEKLNFSLSFAIYKIMALIQEDPVKNKGQLLEDITHAIELSKMMAKRNLYHLLAIKALVCYYNEDKMGTYYQQREAYNYFIENPNVLFYSEKKALLLANIYVSFQRFGILYKAKEFLSSNDQKEFEQIKICISDYEAQGIQRTSDKIFNLPCI